MTSQPVNRQLQYYTTHIAQYLKNKRDQTIKFGENAENEGRRLIPDLFFVF